MIRACGPFVSTMRTIWPPRPANPPRRLHPWDCQTIRASGATTDRDLPAWARSDAVAFMEPIDSDDSSDRRLAPSRTGRSPKTGHFDQIGIDATRGRPESAFSAEAITSAAIDWPSERGHYAGRSRIVHPARIGARHLGPTRR